MKVQIEGYKKLVFRHKFRLTFLEWIDETFSCCIFKRVPPRTPPVSCQTFSTIPGCHWCTDTWYGGLGGFTKSCSKCRLPRGLRSWFMLKGFDNFVDQISEMTKDKNNSSKNNNSSNSNNTSNSNNNNNSPDKSSTKQATKWCEFLLYNQ